MDRGEQKNKIDAAARPAERDDPESQSTASFHDRIGQVEECFMASRTSDVVVGQRVYDAQI